MAERGTEGGTLAPGWYGDPQGRYEARYFDGVQWTAHVMRAGAQLVDPASVTVAAGSSILSGSGSGYGQAPARGRLQFRNGPGAGLAIGAFGSLVVFASFGLPWLAGEQLFALSADGLASGSGGVFVLQLQAAYQALWTIPVVLATTLRYQPGKVVGFLLGGCIGLVVCWSPIGRDNTSTRSNLLFSLLTLVLVANVWIGIGGATGDGPYLDASVGAGPIVATVGFLIVGVGVFVGRRRVAVPLA